ncbi:dihydrofolate reductase [Brachionus plicatilis]|uniref:dihydrofolate reductase n=1 Tax=Brachionus plicatilis TaxID=10195 RepID=A0A3M7TAD8_BRAPC|nr:dihydrofolate reductase [Brachionus plicatilis]
MNKLVDQSIKLSLVVAMNSSNRGIGLNGTIPWHLPKDLKFFAKITTHTKDPSKVNAVIMGRLTWLSIPQNFRPLKNRLNVIISSKLDKESLGEKAGLSNILIFKSFDEAINSLITDHRDKIESIYAIGGSMIYKQALEYPAGFLHRIYLTRVFSDTQCDTFMQPENFLDNFTKLDNTSGDKEYLNTEFNTIQTEPSNNLNYAFEIYEKN